MNLLLSRRAITLVSLAAMVWPSTFAQDGVSKTSLNIGQTAALTGSAATLALPFHQGARLYFERINSAGGINGRSISLVSLDDAGNPDTLRVNAQKLVQGGMPALFGTYGSPQTIAAYEALNQLLALKLESLLVIGTPQEAAKAIREARSKGFRGPIYGFSNTGESLLTEQLGSAGAGVVIARVTPRSDNVKSAVVRELTADAQAAKLGKPNVYMLGCYIAARTLSEALRKAGKEPTQAKLRKAIESISEWDMGGLRVRFDGGRNGSKWVELSVIDSQGKVRE